MNRGKTVRAEAKEIVALAIQDLTEHIDAALDGVAEDLANLDERFMDDLDTGERMFYRMLAKYAAAKGRVSRGASSKGGVR